MESTCCRWIPLNNRRIWSARVFPEREVVFKVKSSGWEPGDLVQTMKKTSRPDFIVGIGGSAGGLVAYMAFLDALPCDTGMAFVIVSHMFPSAQSQLALLLSWHTKMPVAVASTGMRIRANHVYVCPPNADLLIERQAFRLVSPRTINKQVDLFLTSLAEAVGARAIGIVFSGYDGDGTEGCRQIKAKGGTTFAQDASAEVGYMPLGAQASGSIDFVLSPAQIPGELRKLASAVILKTRKPDNAK